MGAQLTSLLIGVACAIPAMTLLHFLTAYSAAKQIKKVARAAIAADRLDMARDLLSPKKKGLWQWSVHLFLPDDLKKLSGAS